MLFAGERDREQQAGPGGDDAPAPQRDAKQDQAGARNAEIARKMSIAPKTVANHISAIFAKLQVADRSEAIILARDAGLGRGNPAG